MAIPTGGGAVQSATLLPKRRPKCDRSWDLPMSWQQRVGCSACLQDSATQRSRAKLQRGLPNASCVSRPSWECSATIGGFHTGMPTGVTPAGRQTTANSLTLSTLAHVRGTGGPAAQVQSAQPRSSSRRLCRRRSGADRGQPQRLQLPGERADPLRGPAAAVDGDVLAVVVDLGLSADIALVDRASQSGSPSPWVGVQPWQFDVLPTSSRAPVGLSPSVS